MSESDRKIVVTIPIGTIVRYCLVFVFAAILFVGGRYVFATTPNPGHPWTDLGNGFWQVANTQTALRTFTFPDADATVLTNLAASTSKLSVFANAWFGATATSSFSSAGVLTLATPLVLTSGGTNASLTASNGGIVYSSATQLQILAGNSSAGKMLQSGASAAPTWSTASYPSAVGTAGQVLMSNGTNWVSAGTSSTGVFNGTQVLTSGTTYTPTTGTNTVTLVLVGGGGGGGGVTGVASSVGAAGGGGSGGVLIKTFSGVTGTYTYAIGGAGSAGANTGGTGGAGGSTTFTNGATTYTAAGGSGGVGQVAGTTLTTVAGGAGAVASTNGDVNGAGAPGTNGYRASGTFGWSGNGASSPYGGGGLGLVAAGAGNAAKGFGGGGGGALSTAATAQAGGAGTAGVIIVYQYK